MDTGVHRTYERGDSAIIFTVQKIGKFWPTRKSEKLQVAKPDEEIADFFIQKTVAFLYNKNLGFFHGGPCCKMNAMYSTGQIY